MHAVHAWRAKWSGDQPLQVSAHAHSLNRHYCGRRVARHSPRQHKVCPAFFLPPSTASCSHHAINDALRTQWWPVRWGCRGFTTHRLPPGCRYSQLAVARLQVPARVAPQRPAACCSADPPQQRAAGLRQWAPAQRSSFLAPGAAWRRRPHPRLEQHPQSHSPRSG